MGSPSAPRLLCGKKAQVSKWQGEGQREREKEREKEYSLASGLLDRPQLLQPPWGVRRGREGAILDVSAPWT